MRALALILMLCTAPAVAATAPADWNFRVLLDGREVGRHAFTLRQQAQERVVTSEAQFDVRLLFFSAWRYDHRAVERWDGDCLRALESRTVTNGERISVLARTREAGLAVQRPEGRDLHAGCVMSFAYWNPRILEAERLLNSQTGELVPVEVTPLGVETLEVGGRPRAAERHRISGPGLRIDVWYADGRWVALEALADGGRQLRYELAAERSS